MSSRRSYAAVVTSAEFLFKGWICGNLTRRGINYGVSELWNRGTRTCLWMLTALAGQGFLLGQSQGPDVEALERHPLPLPTQYFIALQSMRGRQCYGTLLCHAILSGGAYRAMPLRVGQLQQTGIRRRHWPHLRSCQCWQLREAPSDRLFR